MDGLQEFNSQSCFHILAAGGFGCQPINILVGHGEVCSHGTVVRAGGNVDGAQGIVLGAQRDIEWQEGNILSVQRYVLTAQRYVVWKGGNILSTQG